MNRFVNHNIERNFFRKQITTFVDEKKNLILYGNVGTGKTHLAQAIGLEACKQDKVVRFFRTAALVNRLSEAQKKSELNAFMKTLMKADLIICDEWGYVPLDRDGSKFCFKLSQNAMNKGA